jgi:hypothetical protein
MGCCNEPVIPLSNAMPDPSQHVNFAKGMVLGVDDFNQEFAYLAGRSHWLARDAIGYGTLSGLRVLAREGGAEGPQLQVMSGSALVPSGRQVCVSADQCAVINRWLAKPDNARIVYRLLHPASPPLSPPLVSSPPVVSPPAVESGRISLYLTLCHRECLTRPVPIPGEPCRSEDELMQQSRVAEDFSLELRELPPEQVEEDALRDFVQWLRASVHVIDASPPAAADDATWLNVLRPAAQPWFDQEALSPPVSPPGTVVTLGDYLSDLSPPLAIAPTQLCDFLRVAFRFWVTELRPLWMARRCHRTVHRDQDCVLLARVELEVAWIGGSPRGAWQIVGGPDSIVVDERKRPFLAPMRLLQEWGLCGCDCGGLGAAPGTARRSDRPFRLRELEPASIPPPRVPVLVTETSLALDENHHAVFCRGGSAITLALPRSSPAHAGRVYVIKNAGAGRLSLLADASAGDAIEGGASVRVTKDTTVTVIADGTGHWHVTART